LHGWQEEEEEIEEGNSRQRAFSSGCCITGCRGAAGVVAHGTTAVGAIPDDPDGCTNDGGDRSDGPDSHAHNGGDCCPDGANSPPTAMSAMPAMQMGATAMPGVGGIGAQMLPTMGGGGFGTQAMPWIQ